mmetsp:Transcript_113763/g.322163  ORF Transcript_113763/g.322163 Transcript_113763/m.322163 type:complete len:307 (-) Transcript_113763:42-962(-)
MSPCKKQRRFEAVIPPANPAFTWAPGFDAESREVQAAWKQDGYIVVKGLLQADEVARLNEAVTADGGIASHAYGRDDGMGRKTRLALWNRPGNDVTGMIARVPKVAKTMEALLGGEVYHYHSKLMMKDPRTGGAHVWHQDFGYWSANGCVYPDMGTVFIPLDRMDAGNAGLRVLRGSHRCGLMPHEIAGGQLQANPERRQWAVDYGLQEVQLEMEPGDALFFHCLLLHASGQNNSDRRRWCFLVGFNRAENDPVIDHHHPGYSPLELAGDDAIRDPGTPLVSSEGKDFADPAKDHSVREHTATPAH